MSASTSASESAVRLPHKVLHQAHQSQQGTPGLHSASTSASESASTSARASFNKCKRVRKYIRITKCINQRVRIGKTSASAKAHQPVSESASTSPQSRNSARLSRQVQVPHKVRQPVSESASTSASQSAWDRDANPQVSASTRSQ